MTDKPQTTLIETDLLADDARSEMDKANQLIDYLNRHLGYEPRTGEWLSQYRKYLDGKLIRAEVDGWPSPEAHSFFNVRKFIQFKKESA